jgi:hypothetical protein
MEAVGDHGGGKVMRAGDDVGDDLGICGIGDGGFEDADDGGRPIAKDTAIEANGSANDGRIFFESGGPETIREHNDAGRFGTVVLRSDETAENGVEAHDFEIGAANDPSLNFARFTQADHRKADGREISERREGVDAGSEVLDFGDGEIYVLVADAEGALEDVNEAVFISVHEGAKENAAHKAEDGGVGADAESESDDDGES